VFSAQAQLDVNTDGIDYFLFTIAVEDFGRCMLAYCEQTKRVAGIQLATVAVAKAMAGQKAHPTKRLGSPLGESVFEFVRAIVFYPVYCQYRMGKRICPSYNYNFRGPRDSERKNWRTEHFK